jgi:transcription elongation factor Elf1
MTILKMTDYTLWVRYSQEDKGWIAECLVCGQEELTETKDSSIIEFDSHLCFVDKIPSRSKTDANISEEEDDDEFDESYWEPEIIVSHYAKK